jgi:hypothetical protein
MRHTNLSKLRHFKKKSGGPELEILHQKNREHNFQGYRHELALLLINKSCIKLNFVLNKVG